MQHAPACTWKDPDDPDMIQVKFGDEVKFVYHYDKLLEPVNTAERS
jgi:allophanate hydrolase subunit 1